MKNVILNVMIKTDDIETKNEFEGIFDEKNLIIKYVEKDNTKVTLYINNNILVRESKKMYMKLSFDEDSITNNEILIKELDKVLNLEIKTKKIINQNSLYSVEYKVIDGDSFSYRVSISNK